MLLLLEMHHYGFLIAQIFFGLWLVPLGYLAYKSAMFPKALGFALIVGGACCLVGMLAVFLVPDFGEKINVFVTIPSARRMGKARSLFGINTQPPTSFFPAFLEINGPRSISWKIRAIPGPPVLT